MNPQDWRPFIYGGLASCTAECSTFPIDVTKTRLQIQGQIKDFRHKRLKYRGMLHALLCIYKEEGPKALFHGIKPAVLRQATYGTIKFGVYYSLKNMILRETHEESVVLNVLCGMAAGSISSAIANPTDVLKVRLQAYHPTCCQKSLFASFIDVYRLEGVQGLWRGVGPTCQRAAIIAGVELPVYDASKKYFISSHLLGDDITNHFISSFLASLAACVASTPLDVIKTRMMNQRNFRNAILVNGVNRTIYTSSMDCLIQTVRTEGVLALYKGFIPAWVRMGPWNIIFFVTYEQLKRLY